MYTLFHLSKYLVIAKDFVSIITTLHHIPKKVVGTLPRNVMKTESQKTSFSENISSNNPFSS